MKQIIDLFKVTHKDNLPDYYGYLKSISRNGLRVWITFDPEKLEKLGEAAGRRNRGNDIINPPASRVKQTFPEWQDQVIYCAVYGARDGWFYFFLPCDDYEVDVNDVLHVFLSLCRDYASDDFAGFLDSMKRKGYDMNSYLFGLLVEIYDKLDECADLLGSALCNGYTGAGNRYNDWNDTLTPEYIRKHFK